MALIFLMLLLAMALIIAPWLVLPMVGSAVAITSTVIGGVLLLLMAIVLIITRLYRKASANMAFVRTGMGGAKVIKDGGTLVVPVVHQVIPVSLETMRLNVERRGPHALITTDNLRVDLSAEFYIKVQARPEDIQQAARSLGGRNIRADAVSELVQEKLVSALRTVAATKALVELHAKRDEFASAVQAIVMHDLASNGLTLESVTISSLDQTDPSQLEEKNVFDAQGLRKIAEITQKARVERNEIERAAERQVTEQNVETRKKVLEMERQQAEFEAQQRMQVATVNLARDRETKEFQIAQEQTLAQRAIEKQKNIETSEVARRLAVEQAEVDKKISMTLRLQEQEKTEVLKTQTIEVAERAREVAVAQKEQERAAAQAATLTAEAEREAANQRVFTVTVSAEATREAEKKLIAAKQVINEKKIREETEADVQAYTKVKEAEGAKQAAELQYAAKIRLAEGDAQGAARRAEGDKAGKMVDVTVERERVNVEQARVEVERQSLANKQEFEEAALKFEIEKLRIDAERDVRIQAAQAMGNMMAKAQVQIFGDPDTMTKMSQQFMRAASYGTAAEGLMSTLPPEARAMVTKLIENMVTQLKTKSAAPGSGTGGNGHGATDAAPDAVIDAVIEPRIETPRNKPERA